MAVLTLTQENFQTEVADNSGIVLVDFWATWCGPCKMFAPVIDEIAAGNLPGVKVGKVDVDQQPDLAGQFRVMSIPTLVLFKDGKAAVTSVGVKSKKEVLEMIEKLR
ncbi:thioredoxin [Lacrimispora sp.]|uniref:thioredoxin n=1 Tax=Lacrimispora sp. TaxID=2719234 RepID=UPI00285A33BF|nr:thioredoxin [Lacrimispora sp.]MDR7812256.1 thioredoxin [Lacrimispora sp.]